MTVVTRNPAIMKAAGLNRLINCSGAWPGVLTKMIYIEPYVRKLNDLPIYLPGSG